MKLLRHSFIQVRIGRAENNSHRPPELLQLKSSLEPDRMVDSKSSFKLKNAGRVLGMASNC